VSLWGTYMYSKLCCTILRTNNPVILVQKLWPLGLPRGGQDYCRCATSEGLSWRRLSCGFHYSGFGRVSPNAKVVNKIRPGAGIALG
jgi:hypothetical protein